MGLKSGLIAAFALAASLAAGACASNKVYTLPEPNFTPGKDPLAVNCAKMETRGQVLNCFKANELVMQDNEAALNQALNLQDENAAQSLVQNVDQALQKEPCTSFELAANILRIEAVRVNKDPRTSMDSDDGLRTSATLYLGRGGLCLEEMAGLMEKQGFAAQAITYKAQSAAMKQANIKLNP
jgi:hypothetical protein